MSLSELSQDVLANLSRYVSFTDLVLLHACGDKAFNSKMKTSPVELKIKTIRCNVYYCLRLFSRYENVVTVRSLFPSYERKYSIETFPNGVKSVIAGRIGGTIPSSITYLYVDSIVDGALLLCDPEFLSMRYDYFSPHYTPLRMTLRRTVTQIRDFFSDEERFLPLRKEYPKLESITLMRTSKTITSDVEILSIPNCGCEKHDSIHGSWLGGCRFCGKPDLFAVDLKVRKKEIGLPPVSNILIYQSQMYMVQEILAAISPKTKRILMDISLPELDYVLSDEFLEMIPSTIEKLDIHIVSVHPGKQSVPQSTRKSRSFMISISTDWQKPEITDFTGIVLYPKHLLTSGNSNAMRKYPRLGIY